MQHMRHKCIATAAEKPPAALQRVVSRRVVVLTCTSASQSFMVACSMVALGVGAAGRCFMITVPTCGRAL